MVPVVIYLSERLVRTLRSRIEAVKIRKVELINICSTGASYSLQHILPFIFQQAGVLSGNLLSLYMSRPENFKYKSGQYMYLKCSEVSSLEW